MQLKDVAKIYGTAASQGQAPTKAVMEALGVSRATAGRRVAEARALGFLAAEQQRRNPKVIAVARTLGVTYEALRQAVLDYADGDLRL